MPLLMNESNKQTSSSWIDIDADDNIHKFDTNSEYRIILKQEHEFGDDNYTAIYMS